MNRRFAAILSLATCWAAPTPVFAQPSLDEEDTHEIPVRTKTADHVFQVYRDGRRPDQFYYMPNGVRLHEHIVNGKKTPQFTLVKFDYQSEDSKTAPAGGILQFAAAVGADGESLDELKKLISVQYKLPHGYAFKLAAIPIKAAKAALYSKKGDLVNEAYGEGAAKQDPFILFDFFN